MLGRLIRLFLLRAAITSIFSITNFLLCGEAMSVAKTGSVPAIKQLPKLIAFDLDGTIWTPDMYQLYGGAPFKADGDGTKKLYDSQGAPVKLLGISSRILQELKTDKKWQNTIVAWASCTDEPEWAAICMKLFKVVSGISKCSFILPILDAHNCFVCAFDCSVYFMSQLLFFFYDSLLHILCFTFSSVFMIHLVLSDS